MTAHIQHSKQRMQLGLADFQSILCRGYWNIQICILCQQYSNVRFSVAASGEGSQTVQRSLHNKNHTAPDQHFITYRCFS